MPSHPGSRRSVGRSEICVHAADSAVTETIKRTTRPYFVLDGNICALLAAKEHVTVFIYDPIAPDPEGIINQGQGNATARAIQVLRDEPINERAMLALFKEVIANNRSGGWRQIEKPALLQPLPPPGLLWARRMMRSIFCQPVRLKGRRRPDSRPQRSTQQRSFDAPARRANNRRASSTRRCSPSGPRERSPFWSPWISSPTRYRYRHRCGPGRTELLLSLKRTRNSLARLRRRPDVALTLLAPGDIAFTANGRAQILQEAMDEALDYAAVEIIVRGIDDHRQAEFAVEAGPDRRWRDVSEQQALGRRSSKC